MQAIFATVPSLAVSVIYCAWNFYRLARLQRQQVLCQRVTHMLWVMANLPDE